MDVCKPSDDQHRFESGFLKALVALMLLFFSAWSLNAHIFPLYDTLLPMIRELCTLTGGLVLVAMAFLSSRKPSLLQGRVIVAMAVGFAAVGSATVYGASLTGFVSLMAAGACMLSVSEGCCMLLVGMALVPLKARLALLCVVGAQIPSELAALVFPVGYMPEWTALYVVCLMLAAILAFFPAAPIFSQLSKEMPPRDVSLTQPMSFLPFGHRVFVCLFIFRVVYGFMLTFGETSGVPARFPVLPAIAIVAGAVAVARPAWLTFDRVFSTAFTFSIAGLLYALTPGIVDFSISNGLISAGVGLFELFNWAFLAALSRKTFMGRYRFSLGVVP